MREILESLYTELSISVKPDLIDARTKGARAALKGLNPERAAGLALLAHTAGNHEATREWLLERMEAAGESLNRSHAQEIGALASAILVTAWTQEPKEAASVGALAVASAKFIALKPRLPYLPREAQHYCDRAALHVRRPGKMDLRASELSGEPEEVFPTDGGYQPERAAALHRELQALRSELDDVLESLATAAGANTEQTRVLWWLFGERLLDGRSWRELAEAASPFELARDLATMTEFTPGPAGAPAFLVRAMRSGGFDPDRVITVGGGLRVLAPESRVRTKLPTPAAEFDRLQPILCCAANVACSDGGQPGRLRRPAREIADELYREILLSKHLKATDG